MFFDPQVSDGMANLLKVEKSQSGNWIWTSASGGWRGWGFSSVFSDLQKAAEEISRNAAAVAQTAAKSIADMHNQDSEESSKEDEGDTEKEGQDGKESQDENEKQRKAALDKLEKASEDSLLGQASHKFNGVEISFFGISDWSRRAWRFGKCGREVGVVLEENVVGFGAGEEVGQLVKSEFSMGGVELR